MLDPDISTAAALRHLHRPVDESSPWSVDRRRFLQLVGMGMGAGLVAGPGSSLLDLALPGHDPSAWAAGPIGPNDGILLVIGMFGGNDGLNTVVPITDDNYRIQRGGTTGATYIAPEDTLQLDATTGLNPHLGELKRFWDVGQLAIVEGIGHTREEFSHFASMAKWMSGYTSAVPTSGWVGRWLDDHLGGSRDLFAAAEIGHALPLHMIGNHSVATTVPVGRPEFGVPSDANEQKVVDAIRDLGAGDPSAWLGRVGQAQIDQLDVAATLDPILPATVPGADIVAKLEVAARLVNANLGLRVLTAGWGDFDSHASQPAQHPTRMVELNAAIARFFALLHPDWGGRVTIMTFSEFGRTSWGNDGHGTDHGSSAPHFVLGSKVRGGFYGQRPSLAGLERWGRMPTHVNMVDFYGSVIDGWLGGDAGTVLPEFSENLGLFTSGPTPEPSFPGLLLGEYVALNPTRIFDTRTALGGPAIKIGPGQTVTVRVAGANGVSNQNVRAVAVNISSIRPSETTYLTAYPTGSVRPPTSSLNPRVGAVVPNMSIVGVGPDGTFTLYNDAGAVDVTVDMMGYFRRDAAAQMTPLSPSRILDTRFGVGAPKARVRAGGPLVLAVAGKGGVPTTGVDAVVINLTSIRPSGDGWITAWPTGTQRPLVANLSYIAGDVVPNMVICKVGSDGAINLEASAGELDLTADVVACFTDSGSVLAPMSPSRLLDTRTGVGAPVAPIGPGGEIELRVTGRGGVPTAAKAVALNVTGIRPDQRTFLTVYPTGEARPTAASLNPAAGAIAGNLVVAKVGAGGKVSIFNESGSLHLTADVTSFFL